MAATVKAGIDRGGGEGQLSDEALAPTEGHVEQIRAWLDDG